MKVRHILTPLLHLISGARCVSSTPSNFEIYQSLSGSSPLFLDDSSYNTITSTPRDYYAAILLTATDARYGCGICREVGPEWEVIARSWSKGFVPDSMPRMLLGTLDFTNGMQTFQKLMLQTAPVLLVFPPTVGPAARVDPAPIKLDFSSPMSAEQIYTWIRRHLPEGPKPPLTRPINYIRIVSTVTILMGVVTLSSVLSPYILPIVRHRNLWAAMGLMTILLFTSGHMFNHIRKVPYVAGDGRGGISYFAGGFSNQFGLETQIIAAIYAVLSFVTIALAVKVPHMEDFRAQQVATAVWGLVLLVTYSFLLSVFKAKNGSYPFFLPPF